MLLARDPDRTEAEDVEAYRLLGELRQDDVQIDVEPSPRTVGS